MNTIPVFDVDAAEHETSDPLVTRNAHASSQLSSQRRYVQTVCEYLGVARDQDAHETECIRGYN
jgi:hypothetical protein